MPDSIHLQLTQASQRLTCVSDTATLDAEVLLSYSLHKNRSFIRTWPEKQLSQEEIKHFQSLVEMRSTGVPVAYLTGTREFWSRNFNVSPDVLIPRADSELLVELALNALPIDQACKLIDLGTGSGILAICLAAERPLAQIIASDLSSNALIIAKNNAEKHQITNIEFIQSHWLEQISQQYFDLIISNPPYIAENDPHLQQGDLPFEPRTALVSQENGLKDIKLICQQARHSLRPNGLLLIEHGYNKQEQVQSIFTDNFYQQVITHKDLSGQPRVTSGLWQPI